MLAAAPPRFPQETSTTLRHAPQFAGESVADEDRGVSLRVLIKLVISRIQQRMD